MYCRCLGTREECDDINDLMGSQYVWLPEEAEIIRTNTFMETSTNQCLNFSLPHHHTDLPLPDLASIKRNESHPFGNMLETVQERVWSWNTLSLALQFDSTISQLCVFGQLVSTTLSLSFLICERTSNLRGSVGVRLQIS